MGWRIGHFLFCKSEVGFYTVQSIELGCYISSLMIIIKVPHLA